MFFFACAIAIPAHSAITAIPIATFFIMNSFGSVCFHFFFSPLSEPLFYFQGHRATHGFASLIPNIVFFIYVYIADEAILPNPLTMLAKRSPEIVMPMPNGQVNLAPSSLNETRAPGRAYIVIGTALFAKNVKSICA